MNGSRHGRVGFYARRGLRGCVFKIREPSWGPRWLIIVCNCRSVGKIAIMLDEICVAREYACVANDLNRHEHCCCCQKKEERGRCAKQMCKLGSEME